MKDFLLLHSEALYIRFCAIYGDKFIKNYHTDEFKKIWYEEWFSGLKGIDVYIIKDCLEYCKINFEWPPSIAEFRRICEKSSGVPSSADALQCAIRRDFTHPVIAMAYEKVGSWAMKNDKEEVLNKKFNEVYNESIDQFRLKGNQKPKLLESNVYTIPIRISNEENISDRISHLTGMSEILADSLSNDDKYDRIRFLREKEGMDRLKNNPPKIEFPLKERKFNGTKVVYDRFKD